MSAKRTSKNLPPDDLPTYRILTGPDDAAFCHRVSEALALGYELYGPPAATFNGKEVIVAQAIVWPAAKAHVSLMLAVKDAPAAVAWYKRALGAMELWSRGSIAGLEVHGAPFFVA